MEVSLMLVTLLAFVVSGAASWRGQRDAAALMAFIGLTMLVVVTLLLWVK